MRKLRKDEIVCKNCSKIFRVKKNNNNKFCSVECREKWYERQSKIGSAGTLHLSPEMVKKELYRIRNNLDNNLTYNSDSKSKREIILDKMVYDEDKKYIREV